MRAEKQELKSQHICGAERSLSASPSFCFSLSSSKSQTVYIKGVGRMNSDRIRPDLKSHSLNQGMATWEQMRILLFLSKGYSKISQAKIKENVIFRMLLGRVSRKSKETFDWVMELPSKIALCQGQVLT